MVLNPHLCVFCKKDSKSANHIFMHCSFSKNIWSCFFASLMWMWVMLKEMVDLLSQWHGWGMGDWGKAFLGMSSSRGDMGHLEGEKCLNFLRYEHKPKCGGGCYY